MATRIVYCPQCQSDNIKIIKTEVINKIIFSVESILSNCNVCNHKFTYESIIRDKLVRY